MLPSKPVVLRALIASAALTLLSLPALAGGFFTGSGFAGKTMGGRPGVVGGHTRPGIGIGSRPPGVMLPGGPVFDIATGGGGASNGNNSKGPSKNAAPKQPRVTSPVTP